VVGQVAEKASTKVVCNHTELLSFLGKIFEELLGVVSLSLVLLLYSQFVLKVYIQS